MGHRGHRIGVCSWSLQPGSPEELVARVLETGCRGVQLHLNPFLDGWPLEATLADLRGAGIDVLSGMMTMEGEDYSTLESIQETGGVRPDTTWPANQEAAGELGPIASRIGIDLITFHAGWLPHDAEDPERITMLGRLRGLQDRFEAHGVRVALETGQESAATLLAVLDELDGVGVNFDPANMLLYGMGDPCEALEALSSRVMQLHIKDATPASEAGAWGEEVPVGAGDVDWARFLRIARDRCPDAAMLIEREAGGARVADIAGAYVFLRDRLGVSA
jgi:sugar phosphate isomerase/epimerase